MWVVSRGHDVLDSKSVSFAFSLACEPHERSRGRHLCRDSSNLGAGAVSENRPQHSEPEAGISCALDLLGTVPCYDMRNLAPSRRPTHPRYRPHRSARG